jgi:chromosome segregation ATPase
MTAQTPIQEQLSQREEWTAEREHLVAAQATLQEQLSQLEGEWTAERERLMTAQTTLQRELGQTREALPGLKGVRQTLRKAKRLKEQGRLEDADDEYDRVLVLLRQYARGVERPVVRLARQVLQGKLELRKLKQEQQELIYDVARTGTRMELVALADALKARWAEQPELILEEIYGLIEQGGQTELLDYISEPGIPQEVREDSIAVVQWAREVCSNLRAIAKLDAVASDDPTIGVTVKTTITLLENMPVARTV